MKKLFKRLFAFPMSSKRARSDDARRLPGKVDAKPNRYAETEKELARIRGQVQNLDKKMDFLITFMNNRLMAGQFPAECLPADDIRAPIASMATIPERLPTIHIALESLLMQTILPRKIVVYVTDKIDLDRHMTTKLRRQCERGVVIRQVEDVGSHTKLLYALQDYPEETILTFDDDILYPDYTVQYLLMKNALFPDAIVCNYAREISFDADGRLRPAINGRLLTPPSLVDNVLSQEFSSEPSLLAFPFGFSGVLYPPHSLDERVFDVPLFKYLCPTEDDVWFKAMALLKGTPAVVTDFGLSPRTTIVFGTQHTALRHANNGEKAHARQLAAVFSHFGLQSLLRDAAGKTE